MQAHLHVVQHRHILEQTDILKRARDARLIDDSRLEANDAFSVQHDIAFRGLVHTGEHVEHRCFARTVGTDKAVQMALFNGKRKFFHGLQAAECDAKVRYFQQSHASHLLLARRSLRRQATSCGLWLNSIITMSTTAYTSMR